MGSKFCLSVVWLLGGCQNFSGTSIPPKISEYPQGVYGPPEKIFRPLTLQHTYSIGVPLISCASTNSVYSVTSSASMLGDITLTTPVLMSMLKKLFPPLLTDLSKYSIPIVPPSLFSACTCIKCV